MVIDAPEYLTPDQNLFDQDPFVSALNRIYGNLDLAEDHRILLAKLFVHGLCDSYFAQPILAWQERLSPLQVVQAKTLQFLDVMSVPNRGRRIPRGIRPHAAMIIGSEMSDLLDYPFIGEYVRDRIEGGEYSIRGIPLGSNRKATTQITETKTYARWLKDKVEREGKIRSLEVRTVIFSEDVTSPSSRAQGSGHHRGWRRWAILKASEITR